MKIKVSEATNLQLDWLVAKCEGIPVCDSREAWVTDPSQPHFSKPFKPTTDWTQGGTLIEREHIHVGPHTYGPASVILDSWHAVIGLDPDGGEHLYEADGPTPLIAAMRCRVASKIGDEVEVPDELA